MPQLLIPALIASTVISTIVSATAGGGPPDIPEPPDPLSKADPEIARQRRAELIRAQGRNRRATELSGTSDESFTPQVGQSTVLG